MRYYKLLFISCLLCIFKITLVAQCIGFYASAGFGADSICTGGSVMLGGNPTVVGGTAPYTYEWLPSSNLNVDTIANPIASNIISSQLYVVIVSDAAGCIDIDSVTVWYYSKAPFAIAGEDTICSQGNVVLGGNPTQANPSAIGPFMYIWQPNTYLNYDSISNPICFANMDIEYTLTVVGVLGCSDIDSVFVLNNMCDSTVVNSKASNRTNLSFELYPNPISDLLTIHINDDEFNFYDIIIYDITGRVVFKKSVSGKTEYINLSYLESGSYVVQILSEDRSYSRKIQVLE